MRPDMTTALTQLPPHILQRRLQEQRPFPIGMRQNDVFHGRSHVAISTQAAQSRNLAALARTMGAKSDAPTDWDPSKGYNPANLDPSVRAQDDFNEYSIGGYVKAHPLPSDKPAWGPIQQLAQQNQQTLHSILDGLKPGAAPGSDDQKLYDFYHSGLDENAINTAGLTPLQPELDRIDSMKTLQDVQDEVAHLHASGMSALFGFGSTQDAHNPDQVIGEAVQGGLGMPDRDYYLKTDDASKKIQSAYVDHVARMLTLAGDDSTKAQAEAKTVMDIETRLAQASESNVQMRDPNATYNIMGRDQLSQTTPGFDWSRYFAGVGRPDIQSINVATPDFFKKLDGIMKDVSVDDWKTYMRWQVLNQMAPYLPTQFDQENFNFNGRVMQGVQVQAPRWQRVVRQTDATLGDALGQKFVAEKFPPEAKAAAQSMINNILDAARDKIKTGWMGDDTKKSALEKVDKLTVKVGYPNTWTDYSGLDVKAGPYASNVLAANRFEAQKDLASIGKPLDRGQWGMTPATVNAYYNPAMNEIVFPAGILQPPFFDMRADNATNYGAIGSVIGHELSHAFDDQGAQFDAQGRLRNWWTPADLSNFQQRANAVATQFGNFVYDGQHEDGHLVEGEAIADLGGLELAWEAYKKAEAANPSQVKDGFTSDQRFWLSHAMCWATNITPQYAHLEMSTDPHPLPEFRNNGPAADMDEFYQAFNVQPGDKMYVDPSQRAHLWDMA